MDDLEAFLHCYEAFRDGYVYVKRMTLEPHDYLDIRKLDDAFDKGRYLDLMENRVYVEKIGPISPRELVAKLFDTDIYVDYRIPTGVCEIRCMNAKSRKETTHHMFMDTDIKHRNSIFECRHQSCAHHCVARVMGS